MIRVLYYKSAIRSKNSEFSVFYVKKRFSLNNNGTRFSVFHDAIRSKNGNENSCYVKPRSFTQKTENPTLFITFKPYLKKKNVAVGFGTDAE